MEKNVNISINSKVLAAAALSAGIIVGASTAYIVTRIYEHTNLTVLVTHLHSSIKEVKEEITYLENELGLLQRALPPNEEKSVKKRHRKAVSFSSTATTSSYKTCAEPVSANAQAVYRVFTDNSTDTESWRTATTYDTDYFSPDEEEEDEFFDIIPTDDESEALSFPQSSTVASDISDDVSGLSLLLRTVDSLIDKSPEEQIQAYQLLMTKGSKYGNNAEILWRKAKATRNLAIIEEVKGNMKEKKDLIFEAFEYAEEALQINDNSADVHKWYAILAGARGDFLSLRERIASGHVFKEHIDIALQISPNDSTLHHLLGRFCFEVSQLTWVERKVASTLFGEVPSSSFEEALDHFLAAEDLKTEGWKENRLFIAKCYFKLSNESEGGSWLKKALEVPALTAEDEIMDKEIHELIRQYSITL